MTELYEKTFGFDWDSLNVDEAIKRAYVLGVSSSIGETDEEEVKRILGDVEGGYDRNIVKLAYEEGVEHGSGRQDAETDKEVGVLSRFEGEEWTETLEEELEGREGDETPDAALDRVDFPGALGRTDALRRQSPDSTEATKLPEFLRR